MAKVITMRKGDAQPPTTPWKFLGFDTEREMLLDDLKELDKRLKSSDTAAHAIAALSKRKHEVLEQIKHLDMGDYDDDVLDDSDDESLDVGS